MKVEMPQPVPAALADDITRLWTTLCNRVTVHPSLAAETWDAIAVEIRGVLLQDAIGLLWAQTQVELDEFDAATRIRLMALHATLQDFDPSVSGAVLFASLWEQALGFMRRQIPESDQLNFQEGLDLVLSMMPTAWVDVPVALAAVPAETRAKLAALNA